MRKWLIIPVLLCSAYASAAVCATAVSCSAADIQAAINACIATTSALVVIPSCAKTTIATTLTIATAPGTSAAPWTLQGATTCSPCAAGTPVSGSTSWGDNTILDDQGAGGALISVTGFDTTHFVRITGITAVEDSAHGNGMIQVNGTYNTSGARLDTIHIQAGNGTGRGIYPFACCGLIDHLWGEVTATAGSHQIISVDGTNEGGDGGWTPWQTATVFGSANAWFVEDSYFSVTSADAGVEDQIDCYSGAYLVARHNNFLNSSMGCHGTDSGGQRSPVLIESYLNSFINNSTTNLSGGTMRGGTGVWWGNTYGGSHGWNPIKLQVFRTPACEPDNSSNWGVCSGHANWLNGSLTHSSNAGRQNNNGSADWQTAHTYAAASTIFPTSNNSGCAGGCNYYTTSGGVSGVSRPTFNATVTSSSGTPTTSDGTVTWINEGGGPVGSNLKFCAINRDTQCSVDATCSAITGGDTCTTFFDGGLAGTSGYPCRDEIGRAHNQVLTPVYAWNLSGGGVALAETCSSILTSGVDFINNGTTAMPGYTPYTYPNPLQGAGAPAVSLNPSSINFGNQVVSTTSGASTITLTNTGTATLNITTVALTTGTQFAKGTDNCVSQAITVGNNCTVQVTFTPTGTGVKNDSLVFTDDAASSPQSVSLSGTGVTAGISNSVQLNRGVTLGTGVTMK